MQGAGWPWDWKGSSGNSALCASTPRTSASATARELARAAPAWRSPSAVAMERTTVAKGSMGLGSCTTPEQRWLEGKRQRRAGQGQAMAAGPDPVPSASSLRAAPLRPTRGLGRVRRQHPRVSQHPVPPCKASVLRTLPRVHQRDAKPHHANYANHINDSCYSEASPEISQQPVTALLTPESGSWGSWGARGALGCSAAWR